METRIKLNKVDAIQAWFILTRDLNLHTILPLVIDFRETLHLGIPGLIKSIPQGPELIDHSSLLFNLSNSNQPNNLSWHHNRKLLEERTSANIHDISLITIEHISSIETETGKKPIVVVTIELMRSCSVSAFFVLTADGNLECRYINKTPAAPKQIVLSSSVAVDHNTDTPATPIPIQAPIVKPAPLNTCPPIDDSAEDEDIDKLLMNNSDGLPELPDYDDVQSGNVNTAEVESQKYNIEWGTGIKFMLFAPIPKKTSATLLDMTNLDMASSASSGFLERSREYSAFSCAHPHNTTQQP
jgi:hypothetical protein